MTHFRLLACVAAVGGCADGAQFTAYSILSPTVLFSEGPSIPAKAGSTFVVSTEREHVLLSWGYFSLFPEELTVGASSAPIGAGPAVSIGGLVCQVSDTLFDCTAPGSTLGAQFIFGEGVDGVHTATIHRFEDE